MHSDALLDALKESALYRDDHYSYLLYPDRQLKPFLERKSYKLRKASNLKKSY